MLCYCTTDNCEAISYFVDDPYTQVVPKISLIFSGYKIGCSLNFFSPLLDPMPVRSTLLYTFFFCFSFQFHTYCSFQTNDLLVYLQILGLFILSILLLYLDLRINYKFLYVSTIGNLDYFFFQFFKFKVFTRINSFSLKNRKKSFNNQ